MQKCARRPNSQIHCPPCGWMKPPSRPVASNGPRKERSAAMLRGGTPNTRCRRKVAPKGHTGHVGSLIGFHVCLKQPEGASPYRPKAGEWLPGAVGRRRGGVAAPGHGGFLIHDETLWKTRWGWLHDPAHLLETAELCPLRERSIWYVNCSSIKTLKNPKPSQRNPVASQLCVLGQVPRAA